MADDSVTVNVVVTFDDQVRFSELLLAMPDLRRRYYLRWAGAIVLMPAVGLAIGILVGYLADRARPPVDELFRATWSDRQSIVTARLLISAILFALMVAHRSLRRRRLRALSRTLLREQHGIDRDDSDLREHVRCSFGPDGFRSIGAAGDHHLRWAGVAGLDETPGLLVVRTGRFTGFVLPRRDLDDAQVAAIRRIVAANLGRSTAGPWR